VPIASKRIIDKKSTIERLLSTSQLKKFHKLVRGESLEELESDVVTTRLPELKAKKSNYGAMLVRSDAIEGSRRGRNVHKQSTYIFNNINDISKSLANTNRFTDQLITHR
jgi:hypothetical protein